MWTPSYRIKSYHDVWAWFEKARNKLDGRPLGSGYRMKQTCGHLGAGEPIHFHDWRGCYVFKITADDVVHFDGTGYWPMQRMARWFGIRLRKEKLERMALCDWSGDKVPFQDKMQFDLRDCKFLTRAPELVRVVDKARAAEWRKKVNAFRRKTKVMARIGALDQVIDLYVRSDRLSTWGQQRIAIAGFCPADTPATIMLQAILENDPNKALRVALAWDADYMFFYKAGDSSRVRDLYEPEYIYKAAMHAYEKRRDNVRELAGAMRLERNG